MEFFAGKGAAAVLRTVTTLVAVAAAALSTVAAYICLPFLWGAAVTLFVWAFAVFWHIPRWKQSVRGTFNAGNIRIRYGVFFRRELFVPLSSLRTFEIWAPPLHRLYRCRTVVLRFAGGAAVLPLLGCDTAAALTAALEQSEE